MSPSLQRHRSTPAQSSDRWSALDLAEAFQLAHAVATLEEYGLLVYLAAHPSTAAALATRFGVDPAILAGMLEYVAERTELVRRRGRMYTTSSNDGHRDRFLLNLYTLAFRPNACRLSHILRHPRVGGSLVDRAHHAKTFASLTPRAESPVADVVRQLGLDVVLDLGCGTGDLLRSLAAADDRFIGVGVEQNRRMCLAARARIVAAGLGRRIRVLEGDARRLSGVVPKHLRARVSGVTACHVANEMFARGIVSAARWLTAIRTSVPGRPIIIHDYYGRLGSRRSWSADRHTLLHDYVQLISSQGIPPASLTGWRRAYQLAGLRLIHVNEDEATTRFIHVLVDGDALARRSTA